MLSRTWAQLRHPRIFQGWWVLIICTTIVFFSASWVNYGFAVLFAPIQAELGWTTAVTAVAFSLRNIGGPISGVLIDRFGPRKVIASGVLLTGLGSLWISHIQALWAFYAAFAVVAMGNSMCNPMPGTVAVVQWFVRLRSRALAIFTVCNGLGGLTITLMGWMVSRFGWRTTLRLFALMVWVVGLPLAFAIRDRPEKYGLLPDGDPPRSSESQGRVIQRTLDGQPRQEAASVIEGLTVSQAFKSRSFWHLVGAATLSGLGTMPVSTLIVPALLKEGIPNPTVLLVATALPLASLPWRFTLGWWGDYVDKRRLLALCYGLNAIGLLFLAYATSAVWLVPFVLAIGVGFGGPGPLRPAIQADYFGLRSMGTIQGLTQMFTLADSFLGPLFVGWVADLTGSYRPAWFLLGLCVALATPLMLTMPTHNNGRLAIGRQ